MSRDFPGFEDGRLIRPPRGELEFRTVLTFRSQADLETWKRWPIRLELIAKAEGIAEVPMYADISGTAQTGRLVLALTPFEQFVRTSVSGIGLLLLGTAAALVLANSRSSDAYEAFWHTDATVGRRDVRRHRVAAPLGQRRPDGALLLRRRPRDQARGAGRRAALPAAGGAPDRGGASAARWSRRWSIVAAQRWAATGADGWGVPIGTDTAFALGIISLFGTPGPAATARLPDRLRDRRRHPGGRRDRRLLHRGDLLGGARRRAWRCWRRPGRREPRRLPPLAGLRRPRRCVWLAVFESGVHATAGGRAGGADRAGPVLDQPERVSRARPALSTISSARATPRPACSRNEPQQHATHALGRLAEEVETPMTHFQHRLTPWCSSGSCPLRVRQRRHPTHERVRRGAAESGHLGRDRGPGDRQAGRNRALLLARRRGSALRACRRPSPGATSSASRVWAGSASRSRSSSPSWRSRRRARACRARRESSAGRWLPARLAISSCERRCRRRATGRRGSYRQRECFRFWAVVAA